MKTCGECELCFITGQRCPHSELVEVRPEDEACSFGLLLTACHAQRDRARKAEAELTNVWHDLRMAQRRIEQLESGLYTNRREGK